MKILFIFLALLVLSDHSCQSPSSTNNDVVIKSTPTTSNANNYENKLLPIQESITIKTDKIEGIICANLFDWKYLLEDKELWIPTKEQVFEAEERIEQYLKDNPIKKSPDLWRKLSKYKR